MCFLKCLNCGFSNEIKTEYQVLCSKCGSRLENSFNKWRQQPENENKTFEAYKIEISVLQKQADEEILFRQKQKKIDKKKKEEKNRKIRQYIWKTLSVVVTTLTPFFSYLIARSFVRTIPLKQDLDLFLIPAYFYVPDMAIALITFFVNAYLIILSKRNYIVFGTSAFSLILIVLINMQICRMIE